MYISGGGSRVSICAQLVNVLLQPRLRKHNLMPVCHKVSVFPVCNYSWGSENNKRQSANVMVTFDKGGIQFPFHHNWNGQCTQQETNYP